MLRLEPEKTWRITPYPGWLRTCNFPPFYPDDPQWTPVDRFYCDTVGPMSLLVPSAPFKTMMIRPSAVHPRAQHTDWGRNDSLLKVLNIQHSMKVFVR